MNCKDVKEYFDEYSSKLLHENARSEINIHLDSCNDCTTYYRDSDRLSALMDCWDEIEPKHDYVVDFWNRLDEIKIKQKSGFLELLKGFRKTVLIPSVVALLLCSILIINMYQSINHLPTYTDKDIKDEEFLNEIDNLVTDDNYEMLKIYGLWNDMDKEGMEG